MWFGSFDPRAVLFTAPADVFGNHALELGDRAEGPGLRVFVQFVRLAIVGNQLQQLSKLVVLLFGSWILVNDFGHLEIFGEAGVIDR